MQPGKRADRASGEVADVEHEKMDRTEHERVDERTCGLDRDGDRGEDGLQKCKLVCSSHG